MQHPGRSLMMNLTVVRPGNFSNVEETDRREYGSFLMPSHNSSGEFNENATTDAPETENVTACRNEYCVSDDDYMEMVFDYIYPSPYEWCLIIAYFGVFLVGLVGNFLVCFAVWRNHSMRTVTNYFIVNLAVADFLVILICLPPTVVDDVTETWFMGSVLCKVIKYLQGVTVCVCVLTLTCISVERWYAICYPLKFTCSPERVKLMIVIIWLVAFLLLVPEVVALDTIKHPLLSNWTIILTSCKPSGPYVGQAGYQLFLIIGMYFVPLLLMFRNYVLIARCLWRTHIPTETSRDHLKTCEGGRSGTDHQLRGRRKAAKMLIAVVAMFGVCYLPVHLLNILRYAGALENVEQAAIHFALVAHWLCYFNSAINPVIFSFMSTKFRREFKMTCACCFMLGSSGDKPAFGRSVGGGNHYSYRYTNATGGKAAHGHLKEPMPRSRTQTLTV